MMAALPAVDRWISAWIRYPQCLNGTVKNAIASTGVVVLLGLYTMTQTDGSVCHHSVLVVGIVSPVC